VVGLMVLNSSVTFLDCLARSSCSTSFVIVCRRNRDEKKKLEFDWSDKKEADELDTKCAILRNEDTNKQFYPGAARFQEMYAVFSWIDSNYDGK